jgi:hypothetical protein
MLGSGKFACRIIPVAVNQKIDQRLKLTLRQLEVFAAVARGGTTRAAADEISRSQSAASNALGELESVLGVQLFDRVGKKLMINENGRALLPRAAAIWSRRWRRRPCSRPPTPRHCGWHPASPSASTCCRS